MKNDQWDVIKINCFLGPSAIGIITEVLEDINAYYTIVCGIPEKSDTLIYEHEIIEKLYSANNNQYEK